MGNDIKSKIKKGLVSMIAAASIFCSMPSKAMAFDIYSSINDVPLEMRIVDGRQINQTTLKKFPDALPNSMVDYDINSIIRNKTYFKLSLDMPAEYTSVIGRDKGLWMKERDYSEGKFRKEAFETTVWEAAEIAVALGEESKKYLYINQILSGNDDIDKDGIRDGMSEADLLKIENLSFWYEGASVPGWQIITEARKNPRKIKDYFIKLREDYKNQETKDLVSNEWTTDESLTRLKMVFFIHNKDVNPNLKNAYMMSYISPDNSKSCNFLINISDSSIDTCIIDPRVANLKFPSSDTTKVAYKYILYRLLDLNDLAASVITEKPLKEALLREGFTDVVRDSEDLLRGRVAFLDFKNKNGAQLYEEYKSIAPMTLSKIDSRFDEVTLSTFYIKDRGELRRFSSFEYARLSDATQNSYSGPKKFKEDVLPKMENAVYKMKEMDFKVQETTKAISKDFDNYNPEAVNDAVRIREDYNTLNSAEIELNTAIAQYRMLRKLWSNNYGGENTFDPCILKDLLNYEKKCIEPLRYVSEMKERARKQMEILQ